MYPYEWNSLNLISEILPQVWANNQIWEKDTFDFEIDSVVRPSIKVHDDVGILIPSLSALKKWSPVYEPIIEKYHKIKENF